MAQAEADQERRHYEYIYLDEYYYHANGGGKIKRRSNEPNPDDQNSDQKYLIGRGNNTARGEIPKSDVVTKKAIPTLEDRDKLDDKIDLYELLNTLQGRERAIMRLHIDGYNQQEIADQQGISQPRVNKIISMVS